MGVGDAEGALDPQVIVPDPHCGDIALGDGAADDLDICPDPDCTSSKVISSPMPGAGPWSRIDLNAFRADPIKRNSNRGLMALPRNSCD